MRNRSNHVRFRDFVLANSFYTGSMLKKRLQMLNRRRTSRWALVKYLMVLPLVAALLAMTTDYKKLPTMIVPVTSGLFAIPEDKGNAGIKPEQHDQKGQRPQQRLPKRFDSPRGPVKQEHDLVSQQNDTTRLRLAIPPLRRSKKVHSSIYVVDGEIVGTKLDLTVFDVNDIETFKDLNPAAAKAILGDKGAGIYNYHEEQKEKRKDDGVTIK